MEDQKATDEQLESVKPCPHMKGLLNRAADGTLRGVLLSYTNYHAAHCPDCNKTIRAVSAVLARLSNLKSRRQPQMSEDKWQAMEQRWQEAEETPSTR